MSTNILVVEDDFALRSAISATLEVSGYTVTSCDCAESAVALLAKNMTFELVITDIQMEAMSGIDLLKFLRQKNPLLPVILMTAYAGVSHAVEAMRLGACDYLQKPFEPEALIDVIEKYLPNRQTEETIIVDPASIELFNYAKKIALTTSNVLLTGPSGSGKEVMAKYIHQHSNRSEQKFIAINCAAIPENMLESTLFGFEKGAFTGAHQASAGKFEQAQGGTLLLDEISEMPLALQAKILRVIQEKEVERLGGKKLISLDVRLIATTNRDLKEEVKLKNFREDLFYRLNVFPIQCLALSKRTQDIVPLAERLLQNYNQQQPARELTLSSEAKALLISYSWPGNVRELDNLIQRVAVLSTNEVITKDDLNFENCQSISNSVEQTEIGVDDQYIDNGQLGSDMRHHEYQLIVESLAKCQGKKKTVAEQLGISARTLRYKIAKMREAGYEIPDKKSLA